MKKILGLGNALTDILLQVSEDDLRELGFPKGSMNLISREQAEQIQYRFLSVRKRMVAGGSASNTINCIASLGGKAAFIGKIGNDEVGDFYREDMIKNGVKPILLLSQTSMSGFSIVLVTPDGERTFATYLAPMISRKMRLTATTFSILRATSCRTMSCWRKPSVWPRKPAVWFRSIWRRTM